MERIFCDTSAVFDFVDSKSPSFKHISEFLQKNLLSLVMTNFVFSETITLICSKLGHTIAVKTGTQLMSSRLIKLERITDTDEQTAWNIFCKYHDKSFSFVDCTSFAFMKRLGIHKVLTLDQHFKYFGFKNVLK